jgi:hypothetical protein
MFTQYVCSFHTLPHHDVPSIQGISSFLENQRLGIILDSKNRNQNSYSFSQIRKVEFQCMIRIYVHPALEFYPSFCGLEKFMGVLQFGFAFQTVQSLPCLHFVAHMPAHPACQAFVFFAYSTSPVSSGAKGEFRCQEAKVSFHALNNAANRIHATRRLVSTHIVWSFLARDLANWFHDCHICHHENASKQSAAPLQPFLSRPDASPMCIWIWLNTSQLWRKGMFFFSRSLTAPQGG